MKTKYLIGIIPLLLASCTSLDESPKSNQVTDQFYHSGEDAISAINSVYAALITGYDIQSLYNRGIHLATDLTTDDYAAGPRAKNVNVQALAKLTHDASNDRIQLLWQDSYNLINKANVAIDHILSIPENVISIEVRNKTVNEAKFLRALAYFNLVRWFKSIPLVLHEATSLTSQTLNVPQSPEEDVYEQIIKDLKDAENLPSPKEQSTDELGRATSGSAKTLLAKVYLTRGEWELAVSKAKEVIDVGWYDLFENFSDVFNPATKNGKEHIFSVQFKGNEGIAHYLAAMSEPYEVPGIGGAHADAYNPSSNLYDLFDSNDLRKNVTFGTKLTSPTDGKEYTLSEIYFSKYWDQNSLIAPFNSSVNIPLLRYAEVLLMYSEAVNELYGPTPEAIRYFDLLRGRAGIKKIADTSTSLNKDEFRELIFEERRKEFVFEMKRWFDLSRRGADYFIAKNKTAGKDNVQAKHIILPIPQRELDLNHNLKQNPYWAE